MGEGWGVVRRGMLWGGVGVVVLTLIVILKSKQTLCTASTEESASWAHVFHQFLHGVGVMVGVGNDCSNL